MMAKAAAIVSSSIGGSTGYASVRLAPLDQLGAYGVGLSCLALYVTSSATPVSWGLALLDPFLAYTGLHHLARHGQRRFPINLTQR